MRKLKYLLFLFIVFLIPNVFAQEVDVTDYCYGTSGYPRMYAGEEIQYQTYQSYSFGTTYQFQLASISTELRYNLSANTEYTFILNASDDDFRNNFRIWRAYDQNDNNTDLVTGFTYIGYRKIQLTFKTNSATNNVRIVFGSGDVYTNITGEVNWTLQNAVLVIPDSENQEIIDNNNGNTQDIINNNNSNTQDIIENQNQNTQQQIESQLVCKNYDKNAIKTDNKFLGSDGVAYANDTWGITDYLSVTSSYLEIYKQFNNSTAANYCEYNINKELISCSNIQNKNGKVSLNSNTDYIRFSINKGMNLPQFKICTNGNQALNDAINETNNYLKDDSDPSISNSSLNDFFGQIHFTDPLSYLLTLPTQLINKIVSLSDSCSTIDLGTLYGVHLTLPCINLENYLGSNLWTIIDIILSVGLLSVIFKNFYDTISNLLTLGGEKEAKEKFSMPTPMDFLAIILGGDRG